MTLLKNVDNALPLNAHELSNVVLIGPNGEQYPSQHMCDQLSSLICS